MGIIKNIFLGKNPFDDLEQHEKLLLVFEAAHRGNIEPIDISRIDPYLYIIQRNNILDFGYDFLGNYSPICGKLHKDIERLLDLGYLVDKALGDYYVTDDVRELLGHHITSKSTPTLDQITDKLLEMEAWNDEKLKQEYFVEKNTPRASYFGPRQMSILEGTIALTWSITTFVIEYGLCPKINTEMCSAITKDATKPENSLFLYGIATVSFFLSGYALGYFNQKLIIPAEKRFMHWFYDNIKKPYLS